MTTKTKNITTDVVTLDNVRITRTKVLSCLHNGDRLIQALRKVIIAGYKTNTSICSRKPITGEMINTIVADDYMNDRFSKKGLFKISTKLPSLIKELKSAKTNISESFGTEKFELKGFEGRFFMMYLIAAFCGTDVLESVLPETDVLLKRGSSVNDLFTMSKESLLDAANSIDDGEFAEQALDHAYDMFMTHTDDDEEVDFQAMVGQFVPGLFN